MPFTVFLLILWSKFRKIMTVVIVIMLVLGYLLIATSHLTNVNKSAIAMFIGTVGWVCYICYGTDFVMSEHPREYIDFLGGTASTSETVKHFIYKNVFLQYVGEAAAIVLFILATMQIIDILNNNGCFDFITEWIRTRNSKRLLWTISLATFIISANLDNLTTTTMMLVTMHGIVKNRYQRMMIGAVIVLAANAGGCMTVIGDPACVALWGNGAITATNFSAYLILPAITAWVLPTLLISRSLPERLDVEWSTSPYRGDDTNLNRWQRLVMFLVGIGGLWFIPTFHNITKLSPFLGALCVLSVLWIVNEIFNRKLMNAEQMFQRRMPRVLQYGSIQLMLFVMGVMMAMGVVREVGFFDDVATIINNNIHNVWVVGIITGILSGVVDTFTIAMTNISIFPVVDEFTVARAVDTGYLSNFVCNGAFWKITAFTTAVGGCITCFASTSGVALMKMERMSVIWYMRNCSLKVMAGWIAGMAILAAEVMMWN